MMKTIVAAMLMVVCLLGCQKFGADKGAGVTVLNVNDLNEQHKKDKEPCAQSMTARR